MKKARVLLCVFTAIVLIASFISCDNDDDVENEYFKQVSNYSFWNNWGKEAIAQYKFYNIMDNFFAEGKIVDGNCYKDGKIRKILFIGWDGTRADALTNIIRNEKSSDLSKFDYSTETSGINLLKKQGGLYMAYAGGETGKVSEQQSSTCPGWTSELTGEWNNVHGVKNNYEVKNGNIDTIMLKYAKLGLNTSFAFEWGQYFDTTLKNEVAYLIDNPNIPMLLRDTDRKFAATKAEIVANDNLASESNILAESLEHYNKVAVPTDEQTDLLGDIALREQVLNRINAGDDFVAGIFHSVDVNGHATGFSSDNPNYVNALKNVDSYLYTILQTVALREANNNEEWLVILTADHGGSGAGHGLQIDEHRTIWIACNKKISKSYYGKRYNGYTER